MVSAALILPVRNRKAYTSAILHQLSTQISQYSAGHTIEVVVVDDGSTDGTVELITQTFTKVHLLQGDGDLWWTGAIATGMAHVQQQLQTDYIVWLNDDITLADDFISNLIQVCQQSLQTNMITGGIVCDQSHSNWIVFGGVIASCPINNRRQFSKASVLKVDTLNGNIVVLPTHITTDIGLPNAERFRHYGGDYEYICRAKVAGYTIQLSSNLVATTDYRASDVIRYMPLVFQMVLSPTLKAKWQTLQNLHLLKSPHNVRHMVNSIYRHQSTIPQWKYYAFYLRKVIKLFGNECLPQRIRKQQLQAYLLQQGVPEAISISILGS
ncbi:MAG: glycosyltransferase [Cyanobacteria bacterium P01_H01_bin.105]